MSIHVVIHLFILQIVIEGQYSIVVESMGSRMPVFEYIF